MEQAEFASCHLSNIKIAIDFLLLKGKQQDEGAKIANELKSAECIIPLSCRRQSFYQSPWGRPRWEATLPRFCWRPQQAMALTALRWWWHDEDWNVTSSSRDALHPSRRVTINSVIEKGSKDPKTEEETFCKHRFKRRRSKMGYSTSLCVYPLPIFSPYMSASTGDPPETATRDAKPPTADTTDPSTDSSCVASTAKRSVTVTATRRKVPFPTSAWRPTMTHHVPRIQGCKNGEPLPNQPLVTEFGAAFQ